MAKLTKEDLRYKYTWTATPGDDPTKRKADGDRLSRAEGYEVLYFLNNLPGKGGAELTKETRLICEWMLHAKVASNISSRATIQNQIANNFQEWKKEYPY
ncbi:hypothetical protein [Pseudomonas aeruginosa]|uniref:hypothetical protein n=1 Tax=Pseudomonas aeruginosa TaxID=287 RepID=UPI0008FAE11A|nr:hypothetical protein [Pseudomonas aeruginosa]